MDPRSTPCPRQLRIATLQTVVDASFIPVHWRIDECAWQGIVEVAVPLRQRDRPIIAELCALRFLLQVCHVMGGTDLPRGCQLTLSAGAIRKLAKQNSDKTYLIPYARFLPLALEGASVSICLRPTWLTSIPLHRMWRIDASPSEHEMLPVAALGQNVRISWHAIERQRERNGHTSARRALARIGSLLSDPRTRKEEPRACRALSGVLRHGQTAVILRHPPSGERFVIVNEARGPVLVTVVKPEIPSAARWGHVEGR